MLSAAPNLQDWLSSPSSRLVRRYDPAGRAITADDRNRAAMVAVIGQTVYRELFGPNENPIGAYIQVRSMPLQVIGVYASKGQSPFGQDQDDLVMTPFTTAERKVLGVAAPTQQQTPYNWVYL